MNTEQAKKFLTILEAFAEGKKVQFNTGSWTDVDTVDLQQNPERYRIKPKSIVVHVALCKSKHTGSLFADSFENIDTDRKNNIEKSPNFIRWLYVEEVYE